MKINKASLVQFRAEFKLAVAELETKHQIKIELGSISFGDNEFGGKLKITNTVSNTGDVIDSKFHWNKECIHFGLKPEHYGASVKVNNMAASIVDIKPRSHKYPIIVKCIDGKRYKMSASQIKAMVS